MLKGKNAIITGGVRGIGFGIAKEFCKQGANVVISYRSNDEAANNAKSELETFGTKVEIIKGDVADAEFAKKTVDFCKEKLGSVDILVNNAGVTNDKLLMRMKPEDFDSVLDINLNGSFYMLKFASDIMMKQRFGRVINMTSIVGVKGNAGQVNYSASKAGMIGMTLSAAKELGKRGITVNAVAPGYIETDMTAVLSDAQKEAMVQAISVGRAGNVQDIADAVAFLASDKASYITGQVLGVDGGMSV